jgi:hypothetical protein
MKYSTSLYLSIVEVFKRKEPPDIHIQRPGDIKTLLLLVP